MKQPAHATRSGLFPETRRRCAVRTAPRLPGVRRFAFILFLLAVSCAFFTGCSPVDSAGTIPRSNVRAPRAACRLSVNRAMLFEVGENPLEKKTVDIPVGEYIFEGEDDIFLYFRSPTEMEYRVYHKEGYAEGAFQLGGIALARKEQWDQVEYPACTYIDGEDQHQKRLTCPLESSYLMQRRGTDWESDFDKE
ncbi:MAG: hypothetical protein J6Y92_03410 [Lentisphaeria bacterium]|nr:hypothetical protein [Lentisphaeria bacterium]